MEATQPPLLDPARVAALNLDEPRIEEEETPDQQA